MTTAAPLIATELHFSYGGSEVLRGATVTARGGEIVALAGPNGSGKSTLLEVLAGVLAPQRGSVVRSGDLALVVQRPLAPASLPLTARDVVAMGTWRRGARRSRASARAAVAEALGRVGMADQAARPLSELSGGQRQRVFLAQGIVRRPDLLLLDEPAAGLDERSIGRTLRILEEEAARGAAVVCVSHDAAMLAAAHRVVRLDRGRLAESAPASDEPSGGRSRAPAGAEPPDRRDRDPRPAGTVTPGPPAPAPLGWGHGEVQPSGVAGRPAVHLARPVRAR